MVGAKTYLETYTGTSGESEDVIIGKYLAEDMPKKRNWR